MDNTASRRFNYFNLSDSYIDKLVEETVARHGHFDKVGNDELHRTHTFLTDYISQEGKIDVSHHLPDFSGCTDKYLPDVFPHVVIGIQGCAGTGKSFSLAKYIASHESSTFTGSTNQCTSMLEETVELNTMIGSYDPQKGASSKTLFRLMNIKYSQERVNDIYESLKTNEDLVAVCKDMHDPSQPFQKNAVHYDQESVNRYWIHYTNTMLHALFHLFVCCKDEFDNSAQKFAFFNPSDSSHPFHYSGISAASECSTNGHVFNNVHTQEEYVRYLLTKLKPKERLPTTLLTHSQFVVDESGQSPEFMGPLLVMLWYYVNHKYNTPQLHTRVPVLILNGSYTQSSVIGGFPTSMLSSINAVTAQMSNYLCIDSQMNRRRMNDYKDETTVLHKNLSLRREFHLPINKKSYYVLQYQEVGENRVMDSHYMPEAMRMFQLHRSCSTYNENTYRDGLATTEFTDTVFASHRLCLMGDRERDIFPSSVEDETEDEYIFGTREKGLSVLSEVNAKRNIALAFLAYFRENGLVDSLSWLPDTCSSEDREMYKRMTGPKGGSKRCLSLTRPADYHADVEEHVLEHMREQDERMKYNTKAKDKKKCKHGGAGDDNDDMDETAKEVHDIKSDPTEEKRTSPRGTPYITGPATHLLSGEQHLKMRSNVRPMEYYLKDSALYHKNISMNQSGSRQGAKSDNNREDTGMLSREMREKLLWSYKPDLGDLVRISAYPCSQDIQNLVSEYKAECSTTYNVTKAEKEGRYSTFLDRIAVLINDSLSDIQVYLPFQRMRYLVPGSLCASSLQYTLGKIVGVETSMQNLLSEEEIYKNLDIPAKACIFSQYIERSLRWLMFTNAQCMFEREGHSTVTQGPKPSAAPSKTTMYLVQTTAEEMEKTHGVDVFPLDLDDIDYIKLAREREYDRFKGGIDNEVLALYNRYTELLTKAEKECMEMMEKRKNIKEYASKCSTAPLLDGVTSGETKGEPKGETPSDIRAAAYPRDESACYYVKAMESIINKLLKHKILNEFCKSKQTVYIDESHVFHSMYRHLMRDRNTYSISSVMRSGQLKVIGNSSHRACREQIEYDSKKRCTFQKHLMETRKWLMDSLSSNSAMFNEDLEDKNNSDPNTLPQPLVVIMDKAVRRWLPSVHKGSVVAYKIGECLLVHTKPQTSNVKWSKVFTSNTNADTSSRKRTCDREKKTDRKEPFAYIMRQGAPSSNASNNKCFSSVHPIPYGYGINFPIDFIKARAALHGTPTNIIAKGFEGIVALGDWSAALARTTLSADKCYDGEDLGWSAQCQKDSVKKKVENDAVYTVRTDTFPSSSTTLAPTQGMTYTCKAINDLGKTDADNVLLMGTRLHDVGNYRFANVDKGLQRVLLPEEVEAVGGGFDAERLKSLKIYNQRSHLRKQRQNSRRLKSHFIVRP